MLKSENIGYCVDTSGSVDLTDDVRQAVDNADMIILDIKFCDSERYKKFTGGDIEKPLALGKYCSGKGKRLVLRTVVVHGINDTEDEIEKYAKYVIENGLIFEKYELLAFHTMGFFKYENLGIENPLADTPALEPSRLDELQKHLDKILKVIGG